jgi:hypothetical protein
VDDYSALIDPTCILTLPLSRMGRGIVTVAQCAPLIAPYRSPARGGGMVTADDYAALLDPTLKLLPPLAVAATLRR